MIQNKNLRQTSIIAYLKASNDLCFKEKAAFKNKKKEFGNLGSSVYTQAETDRRFCADLVHSFTIKQKTAINIGLSVFSTSPFLFYLLGFMKKEANERSKKDNALEKNIVEFLLTHHKKELTYAFISISQRATILLTWIELLFRHCLWDELSQYESTFLYQENGRIDIGTGRYLYPEKAFFSEGFYFSIVDFDKELTRSFKIKKKLKKCVKKCLKGE